MMILHQLILIGFLTSLINQEILKTGLLLLFVLSRLVGFHAQEVACEYFHTTHYQINSPTLEAQSKNSYSFQNGFDNRIGFKTKPKKFINGFNSNSGTILTIGGLFNADNYPSNGFGAELACSIIINGVTVSGNIGGASNFNFWSGVSSGYTFSLRKYAPYTLLGVMLFSQDGYYYTMGSFEAGVHCKISNSLAFRPAIRFGYGREKFLYHVDRVFLGVFMASLTIDPFEILPYKNY